MSLEGEINLAISEPIIEETMEVLGRQFGITPEELPEYRATIVEAASVVEPSVTLDAVKTTRTITEFSNVPLPPDRSL